MIFKSFKYNTAVLFLFLVKIANMFEWFVNIQDTTKTKVTKQNPSLGIK